MCVFFLAGPQQEMREWRYKWFDGDLFPHCLQRAGQYIFFQPPKFYVYDLFHLLGMCVMFVDGFEDVITEVC